MAGRKGRPRWLRRLKARWALVRWLAEREKARDLEVRARGVAA